MGYAALPTDIVSLTTGFARVTADLVIQSADLAGAKTDIVSLSMDFAGVTAGFAGVTAGFAGVTADIVAQSADVAKIFLWSFHQCDELFRGMTLSFCASIFTWQGHISTYKIQDLVWAHIKCQGYQVQLFHG